jgi:hypothetical protein
LWSYATFGALSIEETAEFFGASIGTAKRDRRTASAWLIAELTGEFRGS